MNVSNLKHFFLLFLHMFLWLLLLLLLLLLHLHPAESRVSDCSHCTCGSTVAAAAAASSSLVPLDSLVITLRLFKGKP